jgi:putative peptidoglycan lipid II flippase
MTGPAEAPDALPMDADATVVLPAFLDEPTLTLAPYFEQPTALMPMVAPRSAHEPDTPVSPAVPATTATVGAGVAPTDVDTGGAAASTSVARSSGVMAIGSLVSRATGFVRTATIGAAIGAGGYRLSVADDYDLANTLPNMVYELLLGGLLASVVIPLLVRARTKDPDGGEAFTHRLLTLATVFLGGATALALVITPLLTRVLTNNNTAAADRHLITIFGYLLLPEIFFYGLAALLAAVLNTRGHFAAPMWTPILNNVLVIATAVLFITLPGRQGLLSTSITRTQILILGVGTTLGIVVQALGLWPALRRVKFRWRWRFDFRALHFGELGRVGGWMLAYVVVSQIGVLAVLNIAKRAGDLAGPGPAIYLKAFLIFMMAHGIVAVSIITALMPRMSQAAADHRYRDVATQLSLGTRLSAVILVPATAAYLVLGRPLGVVLFDWGSYGHDKALATGSVIAASALGLMPFAVSQLQIFAFYAMPDTKTPALINVPVVALRIGIDVALFLTLSAGLVAAGLMLGNAASFLLGAVLGYWLLRRRIGRLGLRGVLISVGKLAFAALIAAVPAIFAVLSLQHFWGTQWAASLAQVAVGGIVLVVVYLAVAAALRAREVTQVWSMVRGRVRG